MKKYIFGAIISLVIIVLALEYSTDDEPVTKVANNKYSISLIADEIINEGGAKKLSSQDKKAHLAEITSRMEQGSFCNNGFTISNMSLKFNDFGGLTGQLTKNINIIEYAIECK